MKKLFFISAGIAFGITIGLVLITVILMLTGTVKQSPFGGIYWDVGQQNSSKLVDDYDKKRKLLNNIKFENVKFIKSEHALKIIYDVINPNNDDIDDTGLLNFIFNKNGKLIAIVDGVQNYTLKPNSKTSIIGDITQKYPDDFDEIAIMLKH